MNQSQLVQLNREWIAHQFDTKIRDSLGRKRVSLNYCISIVVVAFFMALLPLIYVALIGAVIYGTYYHAIHNTWLIEDRNGKLSRVMYLLKSIPNQVDLPRLGQAASKLMDNWLLLYNRLSAHLIHVSEHVEDGFGLEPLSKML